MSGIGRITGTGADHIPRTGLAAIDWKIGDRIGRYVLGEQLGIGGMGAVYRARQVEPFEREVAAKIIQLGMDTAAMLKRFEAERQILALLQHPNIATILDAGSTPQGRPFFIMELVDGVRVDHYADHARLSIRERIELFIQILAGVEHAHQKGVIHRDLKHSNLMVTEKDGKPIAKIIDFGIAKSMASGAREEDMLTRAGDFVGTPDYMSPEQATVNSNELDVRTDVFSLGVVLYELLVGLPPFTGDRSGQTDPLSEASRRTVEHPSKRLRSQAAALEEILQTRRLSEDRLRKVFSGDLSNILLKATEADRSRRYRNVAEFSDDLKRYLEGYPVLARPRSALYTGMKFAQRHKVLIAAGAATLVALFALTIFATVEYYRAEHNAGVAEQAAEEARGLQAKAEREARRAERVSQFLVHVFDAATPGRKADADITVREALRRSLPEIEASLTDEPLVRARVLLAVADVFTSLDALSDAQPLYRDALALARRSEDPELLFDALLAEGRAETGTDPDRAALLVDEALAMQRAAAASDQALARALQARAFVHLSIDQPEEAVPLLEEALAIWDAQAPDSEGKLMALEGLARAWNHHRLNRRTGADYLKQVAALHERRFGRDHHETARVYLELSTAQTLLGPLAEALEHNGAAESIFLATVGEVHAQTKLVRNWRGRILLSLGDFEGAAALADRVVAATETTDDSARAWALHNKALALLGLGDEEAVLELLDEIGPDALQGIQARETAMARAFALAMRGDQTGAIASLQPLRETIENLHLAELLWAEAMVNPAARQALCEEAAALLGKPINQLGERSEILVYGQHERIRRCVGETERADELAAYQRRENYVDLWSLAAQRLP